MSAVYLLRFDDICPTMNWRIWHEIEAVLEEAKVKPLLAVVPDNQDPELAVSAPRAGFWQIVREWQSRDYAIGMHGYQHLYTSDDPGLMRTNKFSEFAGLPESDQSAKVLRASEVFDREGVKADLWIAPAHSFDTTSLKVLSRAGIGVISDGFFLYPHKDNGGILWIPQQLSRFLPLPCGVWTICFHHNRWGQSDVVRFREDLRRHRAAVTSLSEIVRLYAARMPNLGDQIFDNGFRAVRKVKWAVLRRGTSGLRPSATTVR
jgi:hypothetical protein